MWSPYQSYVGHFGPNDGSIDFYGRVTTLASPDRVLLDLGAGRGEWFEDDDSTFRKSIRYMRGKFGSVIAADVDGAVLDNRTADRNILIIDGILPIPDQKVDVIVCDYVLEHVESPAQFLSEVSRVLTPGGWFCARTPHKYNYISIASRLAGEYSERRLLALSQPTRKSVDVFPKRYLLNTPKSIQIHLKDWEDHSFIYRSEPAYYFGSKAIFGVQKFFHRILPDALIGNIFFFLQKPQLPQNLQPDSQTELL